MSWRQKIFTSSLRRWARRNGLSRALQAAGFLKARWRHWQFDRSKTSQNQVVAHGISVRIHTPTKLEFQRLMSLKDDRHLLGPMVQLAAGGKAKVFWDVGANLGTYTILMAKTLQGHGSVFAFEPESGCRQQLHQNIELNGLVNVEVHGLALGKKEETGELFVNPNGASGTHSLLRKGEQGNFSKEVQVVPGDLLVERSKVLQPNIVKIDVEGAEEDVIKGMKNILSNEACRMVLCEVHFRILEQTGRGHAPKAICENLARLGLARQTWLDASHLLASR